ncbi:MAG: hypothetical protein ACOCUI_04130 [bacterium]
MDQKIDIDKLDFQIKLLDNYIKEHKITDISILTFLFDLKELSHSLKTHYIYRKMEKEYKKEKEFDTVKLFYEKSKKVFVAARKFIKTGKDKKLDNLVDTINQTIIYNYSNAYSLFKMEFHIN